MTRHIFIGEANEKRYAHIAEAGEVWRTVSVGNRGVVAEIYHRLQVQAFAGIFIKLPEHVVGISQRILEVQDIVLHPLFSPYRAVGRVAVEEVEVASLEMQHEEVVLRRVQLVEEIHQRLIVLHLSQVLLRPFRHLRRVCHQRYRCVVGSEMSLVAIPVNAVSQFVCDVDNGAGVIKLSAVVLVVFRQCLFERLHGVHGTAVRVGKQHAMLLVLRHAAHPRRGVVVHLRERTHIVARCRLSNHHHYSGRLAEGLSQWSHVEVFQSAFHLGDVALVVGGILLYVQP